MAEWECCYVFRLESRIGRERPDHAKFSSQFSARFRRGMSMQLNALNAGNFGEFANFCWIRIDENANGASSRWEPVHNSTDDLGLEVARACRIKVKANHVRAESDTRVCIVRVRDATDLDFCPCRHQTCRASVSDAIVAFMSSAPAMRSRRAASGSDARINASPMRKPWKPSAFR